MKCFIASAFGHDDVDTIYDRCVVPILRKLSVAPLRVDRVTHNEDLDNKIFELLDSADFVIADLTYARPSVYYEAGYAAGKSKPIIYIARHDHFRARDDDLHGNFRVHFDLQMRNIITWTAPNRTFSNKLLERVRLVLRPLERVNRHNKKLESERSLFTSLPMHTRLSILQKASIRLLRAHSFHTFPFDFRASNGTAPSHWTSFRRFDGKCFQGVGIITTSSASKQLLNYFSWHSLYETPPDYPDPSRRETHYVVASLKPVPRMRRTEALPNFLLRNETTLVSADKRTGTTYVHILDGIKSTSEFEDAFRTVMHENGLTKGA
jgi:nucleoside 2-deoxyribosyltransferase